MDADDSLTNGRDVDGTDNSTTPLHAHLPKRTFEMLYVRLPNRLQAMRLDQFYDALEPRSNIQRETIERLLDVLIQDLNDSRHYPNYTFFAMFARMVFCMCV